MSEVEAIEQTVTAALQAISVEEAMRILDLVRES